MKARAMKALQESVQQHETEKFNKLCQLASELKALDLFIFMRDNNVSIDFTTQLFLYDANTVIRVMAEQGNDPAVDMLLTTFKAEAKHAAEGYARAGRVEKVEEMLLKLDVRDAAARGYAYANNEERVSNLLDRGASVHDCIYGAARGGHTDLVGRLLHHKKANVGAWYMAIEGYAHSEHYAHAEAMIIRTAELERVHEGSHKHHHLFRKADHHFDNPCLIALGAYAGVGCAVDPEKLLKLLTLTENDTVRKHFTDFLRKQKPMIALEGTSIDQVVKKAGEIRTIMHETNVGYDEALAAHAAPKPVVVEPPKVEEAVVAPVVAEQPVAKDRDEPKIVVSEEPKAEVKEEPKAETKEEPKAEAKEESKAESKAAKGKFQLFHLHTWGRRSKQAANDEVKAAENSAAPGMKQ